MKFLTIFILCLFVCTNLFNQVTYTILDENFDNGVVGQVPNGWNQIHSGDGQCRITSTDSYSPTNSFRLSCLPSWDGCYDRPLTINDSGFIIVTLKFKGDQNTWFRPMFSFRLKNKTYGGHFNTINNRMQWGTGSSVIQGSQVTKGVWYSVRIVINQTTQSADYFLDGKKEATNIPGGPPISTRPWDGIDLNSGNGGNGIIYFDDIKILVTQYPEYGLIAYYPFNGNANDESGNGNNGITHNVFLTIDRFGNNNRAYYFNGNSGYIDIPPSNELNSYPITINAWIKTNEAVNKQAAIVCKYYVASSNGYLLHTQFGKIHGWYFRDNYNYIYHGYGGIIGKFIADGMWHMVTFIINEEGGELFVDGVLVASLPWVGVPGPPTTNENMLIGRYFNDYFKGEIDDIRIYNRALSEAEIQALYNEGNSVLEMQVNYLSEGPTNNFIDVPSNGTGYFYYNIMSGENPVYHQGIFNIKIIKSTSQILNTEGYFLSPGILRISIPSDFVDENSTSFMLNDTIQIANTTYVASNPIPTFYATKIPTEYQKTFNIFAGGSAGVSGTIGSIGAGVSVAAAKLSVKGEGGVGIKFQVDQDHNIIIDRRFEASLGVSLEVPSVNPGVSGICNIDGPKAGIISKYLSGQSFSFSGLSLSEEKKKMAQSGFMLETMSLGGTGLSPIAGIFIKAIVSTLNTLGGVNQTFNNAKINEYWGLGLEGSVAVGLKAEAGPVKMSAFDYSAAVSLMYTSNNFNRRFPNIDNIKKLRQLSFSRSFDFSLLNFGLAFSDAVELGTGNFSVFDDGIGMEATLEAGFNGNDDLESISFSLSGGGESTILFGPQKYKYYQTVVEIPKEYAQILMNAGLGVAGLFYTGIKVPLDIQTINQTTSVMNNIYTNFNQNPIKVYSNETIGKGYELNFGIDLDAALGVGLGLSLGVKAKYLDELQFTKKYTEIYANGKNYLIHSSNYSTEMDTLEFKRLIYELFSGTAPLISTALLNFINQITNTIQAGMDFLVGLYDQSGKYIGKVAGTIHHTGQLIISIFSPNSPRIFAKAFDEPVVKNMYYTYDVMHKTFKNNKLILDTARTMMVVVSENIKLSFIPDGQTHTIDSIDTPVTLKMVIDEQLFISNGFSSADKDRVKIYRYDDSLRIWILEGGQRLNDTVTVEVYKMSSYALGIELTDADDTVPPKIYEYGPEQGSINNELPEIYAKIRDNRYGVGIDYTKTFMIINGDTVNYSFNPAIEKIFYQITEEDSLYIGDINVKIIVTDYNNNQSQVEFSFIISSLNDVKLPNGYKLYQNYPNPFNPYTIIEYVLPVESNVKLQIYNSIGQLITTLVDQLQASGNYKIQFNASELAGGTYFVSLYAISSSNGSEYKEIRKMILLK